MSGDRRTAEAGPQHRQSHPVCVTAAQGAVLAGQGLPVARHHPADQAAFGSV